MKACLLLKMSIFKLRGKEQEKEKMVKGWGRLLEGGDYSREGFNREMAIII